MDLEPSTSRTDETPLKMAKYRLKEVAAQKKFKIERK